MKRLVISVFVVVASIGVDTRASASCNVIPPFFAADTRRTDDIMSTIPEGFPYRGARGRTDTVTIVGGETRVLTVIPDLHCGNRNVSDSDGNGRVDADDVVVLLLTKQANGADVRVFASGESCRALPASPCDNAGVDVTFEKADTPAIIRIKLPAAAETAEADPLRAGAQPTLKPGRVTLAVFAATPAVISAFSDVKRSLVSKDCADAAPADALACIDKIYDDFASRCEPRVSPRSLVDCEVASIDQYIDFGERCESDPPDDELAGCGKELNPAAVYVDTCGNLRVPFSWEKIRKRRNGDPVRRRVAGMSAVARGAAAEDAERIWIPGREFLTSKDTELGGRGRKPEIEVWYPAGRSGEIGLKGSVEKDASVVGVHRRMGVTKYLCDSDVARDEACFAVEETVEGGKATCACEDRPRSNCHCRDYDGARFFACEGGDYDGMPCTRPRHCGVGGACTGKPTCKDATSVWRRGLGHDDGIDCETDEPCTASGAVCGYSLFDFSTRAAEGMVTFDAVITEGRGRGVCQRQPRKVCSAETPCSEAEGPCRGFSLEAHGVRE